MDQLLVMLSVKQINECGDSDEVMMIMMITNDTSVNGFKREI